MASFANKPPAGVFTQEGLRDYRPVSLFGDDHLRFTVFSRVLAVNFVTIPKRDDASVSLNGARFPKVRPLRSAVATIFLPPIELQRRNDRKIKFFSERLYQITEPLLPTHTVMNYESINGSRRSRSAPPAVFPL